MKDELMELLRQGREREAARHAAAERAANAAFPALPDRPARPPPGAKSAAFLMGKAVEAASAFTDDVEYTGKSPE